ncbi:MAG: hypothetical protein ACD_43C00023G0006 [uncultured bacterium]|nr:MAG: hypothetical protein ACD_43C00023G0006 [uncultured bacterium]
MKLYKDILVTAWQKTIHQPSLWIFGLFAAFIFGNAGELDRYLRFMNGIVSEGSVINPRFWLDHRWAQFVASASEKIITGDMTVILLMVGLAATFIWILIMMSISAGALIKAATLPNVRFVDAFAAGAKHWVALLVLFASGYGVVILTTVIIGGLISKLNVSAETVQQTFILVGSILFVPLVIVISFLIRFTAQGIVLKNLHIWPAVCNAAKMLKQAWLVTLEMAIVNFSVVFIINLFLLVAVGLLFAPQFATALGLETATSLDRFYSVVVVSGLVYAVLVVFVGAILSTWQWIAWTLLFERLQTEQPASTLLRWLHYRRSK